MADNKIYSHEKLGRVVSFEGLPHVASKSPSDIDAPYIPFVLEAGSEKKYLIGDFRDWGKPLEPGKKILLERHVIAFTQYGYTSIAFIAWHDEDVKIIDAAKCQVVYYYGKSSKDNKYRWVEPKNKITLLERYKSFFCIGGINEPFI